MESLDKGEKSKVHFEADTGRFSAPYWSALRLVLTIALAVFVSEAVVMIAFTFLPRFSTPVGALLEAALLVIFISPVLYFFIFRPFMLRTAERNRAERALSDISEAVSTVTGESFFRELVLSLAKTLNMDYAFIGELTGGERKKVRTLAVSADGAIADNIEYELKGTPCENVVKWRLCCYPNGV